MEYSLKTIQEVSKGLALRIRGIRKLKKITQKELSIKANVSLSSIKRWEEDGEINFLSLIKIARALNVDGDLDNLWTNNYYDNIDEVIRDNK